MRREKPILAKSVYVDGHSSLQLMNKENMKKCLSILKKIVDDKRSFGFRTPVDYVGLNLLDYPLIIKKPMDLSTLKSNLDNNRFSTIKEFFDDLQLIWDNCKLYNMDESDISHWARLLENKTRKLIEKEFSGIFCMDKPYSGTRSTISNLNKSDDAVTNINLPDVNFSNNSKNDELLQSNINQNVTEYESKHKNSTAPEKEESSSLSLKDKIHLSETFKNLDPDIICNVVNLIYQTKPIALEDVDEEKLHIRVDLMDRVLYEKILKLINGKLPSHLTNSCQNKLNY